MPHDVTLIPGDGIGPPVIDAARRVLEASGARFAWDVQEIGMGPAERVGTPVPERALSSIRRTGVALKGPVATPVGAAFGSVSVLLRRELDLYAGVRPCRLLPGVDSDYSDVDLVVIRENTEGMYTGIEFEQGEAATKDLIEFIARETDRRVRPDAGISIKSISIGGSERITRFAMDFARAHGRSRVTAAHKANIMKFTDGLFLETARRVAAEEYPDLAFDDRIIDACCMQLTQAPERFDVLVMPNLYGDIVSDLCAGLIGGLGVAPGANFGEGVAVFEPVHGAGPRIRPPERANPTAMILSGAMLLRHIGEREAAERVERAVEAAIAESRHVTYDVGTSPGGGAAATASEFAGAVVRLLAA